MSHAATITWEFEAIVRGTTGNPGQHPEGLIYLDGQVLRGSLSFESSTPDAAPSRGLLGVYNGAVTAVEIEYLTNFEPFPPGPFDLPVAATPGTRRILVNDAPSSIVAPDRLAIGSDLQAVPPGPHGMQTSVRVFELILFGLGSDVFPTDALPLVPPPLSAFAPFDPDWDSALSEGSGLFVSFADDSYRVDAELTMLRAVPEPGLLALVAVASFALARGASARRRA